MSDNQDTPHAEVEALLIQAGWVLDWRAHNRTSYCFVYPHSAWRAIASKNLMRIFRSDHGEYLRVDINDLAAITAHLERIAHPSAI